MRVIDALAKEEPGEGSGEYASRYIYNVETLKDGKHIYLKRPANKHNGFDFIVCIEGMNFSSTNRRRDYPAHDEIITDLAHKNHENPAQYIILLELVKTVYLCQEPDFNILNSLSFTNGYACDLVVKTIKWFFIEQDIRYWNYSGRNMLWNSIITNN
jgi:hypothetical protein